MQQRTAAASAAAAPVRRAPAGTAAAGRGKRKEVPLLVRPAAGPASAANAASGAGSSTDKTAKRVRLVIPGGSSSPSPADVRGEKHFAVRPRFSSNCLHRVFRSAQATEDAADDADVFDFNKRR